MIGLDQKIRQLSDSLDHEMREQTSHWSDEGVCKFYLGGLCPFGLFADTNADIGRCRGIHSVVLKAKYEASKEYGTMGYEESLISFLNAIVRANDKRVLRAFENLPYFVIDLKDPLEQISYKNILKDISEIVKATKAKGQTDWEENNNALQELAKLSNSIKKCTRDPVTDVCLTCGAFTVRNDPEIESSTSLGGREHDGFLVVRQKVRNMNVKSM
ncbi:Luc7-like protein 3 [Thelohanellus kitauei]|uniref:Luc7-like protein 3 n=1 Tax=Thelohanellus kitauei TaxID=669202 RepID=A0A0C2MI38_THEKT|nr:Luc7-like protein 3 [Thelohanellus kitauei]